MVVLLAVVMVVMEQLAMVVQVVVQVEAVAVLLDAIGMVVMRMVAQQVTDNPVQLVQ